MSQIQHVWTVDGVTIWNLVSPQFIGMELHIHGLAKSGGDLVPYRMYRWTATVTPNGWKVWIVSDTTNRTEMFQGATFNLVLEVAAAIKRSL